MTGSGERRSYGTPIGDATGAPVTCIPEAPASPAPVGRRPLLDRALSALLATVWIGELGNLLLPMPALAHIAAAALCGFLALALGRASGHVRALSIIAVSTAALLAIRIGAPSLLLDGLRHALVFGAFLASIVMLRATVEHSGRIESLRNGVADLDDDERLSWMVHGSHLLGAMLNVGAMAVLAPVTDARKNDALRDVLAAGAVRGLGTAVAWSPFFVAMGFVSHLLSGVRIEQVMLLGVGLAMIGLLLSHAMFTPTLGWTGLRRSLSRLTPLAAPTALFLGPVLAVIFATHMSGTQAVAMMLPVVCLVYLLFSGRAALTATAAHGLHGFARIVDEMLIVVGASLLGTVVAHLPIAGESFVGLLPALSGWPVIALLVTALVAMGLLGLHPMIGASILVPILGGGRYGVADIVLVEGAVFAWGLSATLAVWTMPVAVAASVFRVRMRTLGTGPNLLYGAGYLVCGIAYLAFANHFLR